VGNDTNHYTQVKITVTKEVASAFKSACATQNVSMASTLTQFMVDYSNIASTKKKASPDYSTKRKRRAAIKKINLQLEQIKMFETSYCNNIPDNLQGSVFFENAEEFISCLDSAIDALSSIE